MLIFCDICDKSAVFNILRQNETIFDLEMDRKGGNKEKMRNVESESLFISSFPLNFLILCSFPLHFLILSPFSVGRTVPYEMMNNNWYLTVLGQYMAILAGTWSV